MGNKVLCNTKGNKETQGKGVYELDIDAMTKVLFRAISSMSLMTTSLLAVLLAPIPDLPKGIILGTILSTYVWLVILVYQRFGSHNCPEDNPKPSDTMPWFEFIIECLIEEPL